MSAMISPTPRVSFGGCIQSSTERSSKRQSCEARCQERRPRPVFLREKTIPTTLLCLPRPFDDASRRIPNQRNRLQRVRLPMGCASGRSARHLEMDGGKTQKQCPPESRQPRFPSDMVDHLWRSYWGWSGRGSGGPSIRHWRDRQLALLVRVYPVERLTKLLARLQSGSRGSGGLVKATVQKKTLILEFADTDRRIGDCCSEGYIRVKYRWQAGRFIETGARTSGSNK